MGRRGAAGFIVRILYFADTPFPTDRANGIQMAHTCHALAVRGHVVTLVVRPDTAGPPRDPLDYYGLEPCAGLSVVQVGNAGTPAATRARFLICAVLRALFTRKVDIVLTRDLGVASALLAIPPQLRARVVYESHAFARPSGQPGARPARGSRDRVADEPDTRQARERSVWQRADGYVSITSGLSQELAAQFGARTRAAVVPDGVTIDPARSFTPPVSSGTPVVAYAGRMSAWKGVDVLLEALAALPGTRGLILGGQPDDTDLLRTRARATELGIDECVTLLSSVPPTAIAGHLASADILVHPNTGATPSARYTAPLVLFEYLAAGRPIVASDLPALREVLRHEENCLLVPPGDAAALAEAIRTLTANRPLADRIARRAFEDAAAFGWDQRAARLERLFGQLLQASR